MHVGWCGRPRQSSSSGWRPSGCTVGHVSPNLLKPSQACSNELCCGCARSSLRVAAAHRRPAAGGRSELSRPVRVRGVARKVAVGRPTQCAGERRPALTGTWPKLSQVFTLAVACWQNTRPGPHSSRCPCTSAANMRRARRSCRRTGQLTGPGSWPRRCWRRWLPSMSWLCGRLCPGGRSKLSWAPPLAGQSALVGCCHQPGSPRTSCGSSCQKARPRFGRRRRKRRCRRRHRRVQLRTRWTGLNWSIRAAAGCLVRWSPRWVGMRRRGQLR